MNDNPLLSAAGKFFSQETILAFIYVLVFLILCNRLQKYTQKLRLYEWFTHLITASATFCLMMITYLGIKYCSAFVYKLRFNSNGIDARFQPQHWDLGVVIVAMVGSGLLYSIYKGFNKILTNKIDSFTKKSIVDGLIIFTITNFFFLTANGIQNGSITVGFRLLSEYISVTVGCSLAFLVYGYQQYLKSFQEQEKELKIARLQQEVAQSQLDALSSKINPHFLYNALNSIAGLATTDGLKTRDMSIALANLFRYNINKEESNYASIADEMQMVRIYLEIEKIRFEENLQYHINIDPELDKEVIPKHLLQPLVENAVKHGTGRDGVNINISIKRQEKQMIIAIGDDGKPFDVNFNPGYGIKSLYDKLDLLTHGNYEIAFLTAPKEVRITLGEYSKLI